MLETLIFREIRYNNNNEEMLVKYQNKIAENSEDIEALQTLASIYHALKENEKAIEIYEKLVILKPEDHEIRAFLGYLYYEEEELDKAEENLNRALDINAAEPFVLFLLGNVYARRGRISDAVDCYDLAIFLDFDIYTAHIDFARKYEHMGRHKKALKEFKAAFEIDSRDEGLIEKIKYIENKCRTTGQCDMKFDERNYLVTSDKLVFNI
ncbi:tetratricopeptide repeat protein [Leptotrichia sp. OH3620_COT-345]|uniref:tetratricopeptide repeat protein n=1 Tax=Leptotrichia sp. OH3620_COT-345 TaxID=2491048 RepID=UPI000F6460CD|nr:tetratricopeptide repeat protein [Leptotrichia sp. OH3620_COT-345]RRD37938.1 tetratricopeptide repeat protein [Leptotrichia sp. OH3620_COT-345]